MFAGLWPGFDQADVPITSVTNGVHAPTWTDPLLTELAACSRQLGAWTAQLSRTGSLHAGLPAAASQGLRAASRWLRTAANSDHAAHRPDPPAARAFQVRHTLQAQALVGRCGRAAAIRAIL